MLTFIKILLTMSAVISVKNFTKSFGKVKVILGLDFEVFPGELFAFLGANGSGKTTTIRCLLNIYSSDSGTLLVNGQSYSTEQASILGYLPEERGLYNNSKVLETMIYFGRMKGMRASEARKKSLEFLDRVDLSDKAQTQIKKLSSGQQQKIQLGITVINEPQILILDEPTKGLDPVNRSLLLELLFDLNKKKGTTILFSTHQMDEVEKIADRLLMLKSGKSVLYGKIGDVKKQFGENIIHLDFVGDFPKNDKLYKAKVSHNYAEINPNEGVSENEVLQFMLKSGLVIKNFQVAEPSLNEIFIKVASEK
jgi:ABC-2 type transport system ATP-binding protein